MLRVNLVQLQEQTRKSYLNGEHNADDGKNEGRPAAAAEEGKECQTQVVLRPYVARGDGARENTRLVHLWGNTPHISPCCYHDIVLHTPP